jgi:phage shock protein PspC (stress-responsive transcriptional regulator)
MTPHSRPSYDDQSADNRYDWWSRRPRRSRNDRKIAGVAGGLARAFGIDPIIIRIAFVVLAIFGGSGVLLYALCWLLLPADGDQVSALESLLGRGQSSVSSLLTVVLIVVVISSAGSVFSWGLPFWPVVIGAIIVFALARRGRLGNYGPPRNQSPRQDWNRQDWNQWGNDVADKATRWANGFAERASQWGQCGRPGPSSTGGTANPGTKSPFEHPAFWDAYSQDWHASNPSASQPGTSGGPTTKTRPGSSAPNDSSMGTASRVADPTSTATASAASSAGSTTTAPSPEPPSPSEMLTGNRTPPSWDPLGVAPFAWDLPDPSPAPGQPEPQYAQARRGRSAVSRVFLGLGLIGGALAAVGVIAGWWALSWAEVSAIALTIVAVGLIIGALRGRGRSLIGPGIFLAILTMALTVTGIRGTSGFGEQSWTPTTFSNVQPIYSMNAGQGTLDLSGLTIPSNTTVTTTLDVRAGQATVIVPSGVTVHATCSANMGQVDCLNATDQGMRPSASGMQHPDGSTGPAGNGVPNPPAAPNPPASGSSSTQSGGTLNVTVKVGVGEARVGGPNG